ncbi:MAG: hypothetical protein ACRBCL_04415 [Maritimibacter sp.]
MTHPTLADGETLLASFTGDRSTYIKEHIILALIAAVGGVAILMVIGNPFPWTGAVGGIAAIAVRGFYVASEQVGMTWLLTERAVVSPAGVRISRADIDKVNTIFSAAQIVTKTGDKYMLKYQADPKEVKRMIESGGT